jgi:hypothetical protein
VTDTTAHQYRPDWPADVDGGDEIPPPSGGWPCRVCGGPYTDPAHTADEHPDGPVQGLLLAGAGHQIQPWSAFQTRGLLWLVNCAVFHPRGYALAVHYAELPEIEGETDDERRSRYRTEVEAGNVEAIGWSIIGDGTEAWYFDNPPDDPGMRDRRFQAVLDLLAEAAQADRERAQAAAWEAAQARDRAVPAAVEDVPPEGVHDVEHPPV